jgi:hypothetical protein
MASVFKFPKNAKKRSIFYTDENGKRRKKTGYTDTRESERLLDRDALALWVSINEEPCLIGSAQSFEYINSSSGDDPCVSRPSSSIRAYYSRPSNW